MHQKQNFINLKLFMTEAKKNCRHVAIYCCCTAWFVLDLVGNTGDSFSRDSAHMSPHNCLYMKPWSFSQAHPMAEWLRPLSSND